MSFAQLIEDPQAFARALSARDDLDAFDESGWTLLHHAVHRGRGDLVDALVAAGANPNARCDASSVSRALAYGGPALLLAVDAGDLSMVERLLAIKGRKRARADTGNGCGLTPLHVAAGRGHLDVTRKLLVAKAKVDAKVKSFEGHLGLEADARPLHAAAAHGTLDTAAALLDAGASIDPLDTARNTPLVYAACAGNDAVVDALLDRGAVVHGDPRGSSPLRAAASEGRGTTIRRLLERGALWHGKVGETPLHLAARNLHDDAVVAALDAGFDPNARDDNGWTALHWAAFGGNPSAARALRDRGADADVLSTRDVAFRALSHKSEGWLHRYAERNVPKGSSPADVAALAQMLAYAWQEELRPWNERCDAIAKLLPSPPSGRALTLSGELTLPSASATARACAELGALLGRGHRILDTGRGLSVYHCWQPSPEDERRVDRLLRRLSRLAQSGSISLYAAELDERSYPAAGAPMTAGAEMAVHVLLGDATAVEAASPAKLAAEDVRYLADFHWDLDAWADKGLLARALCRQELVGRIVQETKLRVVLEDILGAPAGSTPDLDSLKSTARALLEGRA